MAAIEERHEFAQEANNYSFSPLLFWLRDGKDMAECIARLHPDRLIEWPAVVPRETTDE